MSQPTDRPAPPTWIDEVVRAVAELPGRTSPDDWPDAMLVTAVELRTVIEYYAPARPETSAPPAPESEPQQPPTTTDGQLLDALARNANLHKVIKEQHAEIVRLRADLAAALQHIEGLQKELAELKGQVR